MDAFPEARAGTHRCTHKPRGRARWQHNKRLLRSRIARLLWRATRGCGRWFGAWG